MCVCLCACVCVRARLLWSMKEADRYMSLFILFDGSKFEGRDSNLTLFAFSEHERRTRQRTRQNSRGHERRTILGDSREGHERLGFDFVLQRAHTTHEWVMSYIRVVVSHV